MPVPEFEYNRMKTLRIDWTLDNFKAIEFAVYFFRNAPALENLHINVSTQSIDLISLRLGLELDITLHTNINLSLYIYIQFWYKEGDIEADSVDNEEIEMAEEEAKYKGKGVASEETIDLPLELYLKKLLQESGFFATFEHLDKMVLENVYGTDLEIIFIKHVLGNAPQLEEINITLESRVLDTGFEAEISDFAKELDSFPKASPGVEIIIQ